MFMKTEMPVREKELKLLTLICREKDEFISTGTPFSLVTEY